MSSDRSDSIFDLAGKKKEMTPLKRREEGPKTAPAHGPSPTSTPQDVSIEHASIQQMNARIEEMKQKCQELNHRLQEIYDLTGYNPDTIKEVLNQASQLGVRNWDAIEREQKRFDQQIAKLYGSRAVPETSKAIKLQEKKRKGKSLGSRKNWLSM